MIQTDVVIIGAGPVGLFAIFEAGMLRAKCHVIDSLPDIGGQCSALYPEKPIYDIPAYPRIMAGELIEKLQEQAAPFHPTYHLNQQVIGFKKNPDGSFMVETSLGTKINCKVVIIAAGAGAFGPNKPPLAHLEEYENKSIFYHVANKDKFKDKKIVIAGGGDSAIDWALELSPQAEKIYLIHRRDKFRCAPESFEKVKQIAHTGKIELVTPYQLSGLKGENGILHRVELQTLEGNTKLLEADYLLSFFGLRMELGPINNWALNIEHSHIKVEPSSYETNIEGVYAIGDIATYPGKIKLILTGFAEAARALHHAYPLIFDGKALHFEYSTSKGAQEL